MTGIALAVEGVGKAYRRYAGEFLRVAGFFGLRTAPVEENWVVRGASFVLRKGEALALVGRNGAGKSTLLKIIAGTTRPTTGRVCVEGRIAAILELGMGFNPELTARANARHVGGLLGHTPTEVAARMNEISAFAEIGEYFDQPLRLLSSGMQMRVAFAVATAFRPDVLIIDEALSVGDVYFQHKSFERIRALRNEGVTLVFVSHDPSSVLALCDRAILMDRGRIVLDGDPGTVMDHYNMLLGPTEGHALATQAKDARTDQGTRASGTGEARSVSITLSDDRGRRVDVVSVGSRVRLTVLVRIERPIERLVLGFSIRDRVGQTLFGTNTHYSGQAVESPSVGALYSFEVMFPVMLGAGSYSVSTALVAGADHRDANYEWRDHALVFSVSTLDAPAFAGCLYLPVETHVETVPSRQRAEG